MCTEHDECGHGACDKRGHHGAEPTTAILMRTLFDLTPSVRRHPTGRKGGHGIPFVRSPG